MLVLAQNLSLILGFLLSKSPRTCHGLCGLASFLCARLLLQPATATYPSFLLREHVRHPLPPSLGHLNWLLPQILAGLTFHLLKSLLECHLLQDTFSHHSISNYNQLWSSLLSSAFSLSMAFITF